MVITWTAQIVISTNDENTHLVKKKREKKFFLFIRLGQQHHLHLRPSRSSRNK
ncbi:unnamed protein product [Brassica napus]|uniref:(rape) hypothetical protein n=1 Tax=Brassica napus TaxID=3708 RepID=A0A816NEB3_BRANA|nr:unnamed protein product [Brassica napus]